MLKYWLFLLCLTLSVNVFSDYEAVQCPDDFRGTVKVKVLESGYEFVIRQEDGDKFDRTITVRLTDSRTDVVLIHRLRKTYHVFEVTIAKKFKSRVAVFDTHAYELYSKESILFSIHMPALSKLGIRLFCNELRSFSSQHLPDSDWVYPQHLLEATKDLLTVHFTEFFTKEKVIALQNEIFTETFFKKGDVIFRFETAGENKFLVRFTINSGVIKRDKKKKLTDLQYESLSSRCENALSLKDETVADITRGELFNLLTTFVNKKEDK